MSDSNEMAVTCLCGAVRLLPQRIDNCLGACHCNTCRKWGSGPYLSIDCGTEIVFEGQKDITVFNSSEWAERGFCSKCGTHLFYRLAQTGQYFVSAGLLGDVKDFEFDHQVFIDEKPTYYTFANKTDDMTGAELFAKYGGSTE